MQERIENYALKIVHSGDIPMHAAISINLGIIANRINTLGITNSGQMTLAKIASSNVVCRCC